MFLLGGLKKSNLFYIDSEHLHQWMERSIATILLCIHTFLFISRYGKKDQENFSSDSSVLPHSGLNPPYVHKQQLVSQHLTAK